MHCYLVAEPPSAPLRKSLKHDAAAAASDKKFTSDLAAAINAAKEQKHVDPSGSRTHHLGGEAGGLGNSPSSEGLTMQENLSKLRDLRIQANLDGRNKRKRLEYQAFQAQVFGGHSQGDVTILIHCFISH